MASLDTRASTYRALMCSSSGNNINKSFLNWSRNLSQVLTIKESPWRSTKMRAGSPWGWKPLTIESEGPASLLTATLAEAPPTAVPPFSSSVAAAACVLGCKCAGCASYPFNLAAACCSSPPKICCLLRLRRRHLCLSRLLGLLPVRFHRRRGTIIEVLTRA